VVSTEQYRVERVVHEQLDLVVRGWDGLTRFEPASHEIDENGVERAGLPETLANVGGGLVPIENGARPFRRELGPLGLSGERIEQLLAAHLVEPAADEIANLAACPRGSTPGE
jgi:hypothetical protein